MNELTNKHIWCFYGVQWAIEMHTFPITKTAGWGKTLLLASEVSRLQPMSGPRRQILHLFVLRCQRFHFTLGNTFLHFVGMNLHNVAVHRSLYMGEVRKHLSHCGASHWGLVNALGSQVEEFQRGVIALWDCRMPHGRGVTRGIGFGKEGLKLKRGKGFNMMIRERNKEGSCEERKRG